jgi:hypothetical protein
MKFLPLIFLAWSVSVFAEEKVLTRGQSYTVPEGIVWIVKNAPSPECRVCTADLYTKGKMSQVEINGVIFQGIFEISFYSDVNGPIKLLPGTSVWLGDSRPTIVVQEQKYLASNK